MTADKAKIKAYEFIVMEPTDTGFRVVRGATSKKELIDTYKGNGELLNFKDVTALYAINADYLENTLRQGHFGEAEISIIMSAVKHYCATE